MSPPTVDSTKDVEKKSTQRRINKPLIEKRRRARINDSLSQLKSIVLEANDTKSTRPSKLEKADILEMTVEFVKKMLSQSGRDTASPITNQNEYRAGYAECLAEISRFLETSSVVNGDLKKDIVEHVTSKLTGTSHTPEVETRPVKTEAVRIVSATSSGSDVESNDNEAIDLRTAKNRPSSESSVAEKLKSHIPVLPKQIDLSNAKFITTTTTATNNNQASVINQNLPVGLLCGNQVMVLLQLPSLLTSGPCLTQGAVFGSPLKTSTPAFNILPQDQSTYLQTSDIYRTTDRTSEELPKLISVPQGLPVQRIDKANLTNQQSRNVYSQEVTHDIENGDDAGCLNKINVSKSCCNMSEDSGGKGDDHWRPW